MLYSLQLMIIANYIFIKKQYINIDISFTYFLQVPPKAQSTASHYPNIIALVDAFVCMWLPPKIGLALLINITAPGTGYSDNGVVRYGEVVKFHLHILTTSWEMPKRRGKLFLSELNQTGSLLCMVAIFAKAQLTPF